MNDAYKRFDALLKAENKRPSDITKETGIKSTVLTEWKSGKSQPKTDKLILIAHALNTTVEYLITGNSDYAYHDFTAQNGDMKILIETARGASSEHLKLAAELLRQLKGGAQ